MLMSLPLPICALLISLMQLVNGTQFIIIIIYLMLGSL